MPYKEEYHKAPYKKDYKDDYSDDYEGGHKTDYPNLIKKYANSNVYYKQNKNDADFKDDGYYNSEANANNFSEEYAANSNKKKFLKDDDNDYSYGKNDYHGDDYGDDYQKE